MTLAFRLFTALSSVFMARGDKWAKIVPCIGSSRAVFSGTCFNEVCLGRVASILGNSYFGTLILVYEPGRVSYHSPTIGLASENGGCHLSFP